MVIGAVTLSSEILVFVAVTTRLSRSSMFSDNNGTVNVVMKSSERKVLLFISLNIIIPHNELYM